MEFQMEEGRLYLADDAGHTTAEITFRQQPGGPVVIEHTYVSPTLRGQGMAGKLTKAAADHLRSKGVKVRPVCPYVVEWFALHPEEQDLLV